MKYITNLNRIDKDSSKLYVNYTWTEDNTTFNKADITMNLTDVDITGMQDLIASKLWTSADAIDTFVYQAQDDTIELNRRFLVNLINRPIQEDIILNINPQFKIINGKRVIINVSAFTEDEIGVTDPTTGEVIKHGIINDCGFEIINFIQTEINK